MRLLAGGERVRERDGPAESVVAMIGAADIDRANCRKLLEFALHRRLVPVNGVEVMGRGDETNSGQTSVQNSGHTSV